MSEEKTNEEVKQDQQPSQDMSKDQQIGFHKGALSTLAKEREELARMLSIVEQLMQMHVKALKDQGVDLQAQAQEQGDIPKKPEKPIDEML